VGRVESLPILLSVEHISSHTLYLRVPRIRRHFVNLLREYQGFPFIG
jgi:hypothetical protein